MGSDTLFIAVKHDYEIYSVCARQLGTHYSTVAPMIPVASFNTGQVVLSNTTVNWGRRPGRDPVPYTGFGTAALIRASEKLGAPRPKYGHTVRSEI